LAAGLGWLAMEAAAIADANSLSELLTALPVVVAHTRFGQVVSLRLVLLVCATVLAGSGRVRIYTALGLTGAAVVLQPLIGHAGATEGAAGYSLIGSEAFHLLAAGIWLGALLPLLLTARAVPLGPAASACERFSPIGLGCVLVLAGTGLVQALQLVGSLSALVDTAYGRIALVKICLFLAALVLAAYNRLWLTDRLAEGQSVARRHLYLSVSVEMAAGLMIIIAAAFLASTMPGMHEHTAASLPAAVQSRTST
jgi:putative copper export protein